MQGRFHLDEGYRLQDVTFPLRVIQLLDIKKLIVSHASGSIN